MNRHVTGACAALVLSGICCFTGMGAVQLRRWTVAHERAEDEARYRRLEPPPTPLYAVAGKKLYTWAMFLCFGAGGVLLLTGSGVAAASAYRGPPAPAPGQGVVFRRRPTFECLLLVALLLTAPALVGGVAMSRRNPAPMIPGVAMLLLVGAALLALHAGTARVADAEGITLGLGRRFLWADLVGCDYVTEVQRTSSGARRVVGGYHRVRFKGGSFKLRSVRYTNWDECWAFVEPRLRDRA